MPLEAQIRHHRGDDAGFRQPPVIPPALGDHRQQLVAIDQMAVLVGDDDAIGVAIERDADIGAHFEHLAAERLGRSRAAFAVDVEAVRLDADGDHVGAQLPERAGRDAVGGAVGAVEDDAQALERKVARQRALGEFDVAVVHAVDALGAAEVAALGHALGHVAVDQAFDLALDLVRKLVAVRAEQLDAVVVERVVRGRDHHPQVGAHRAGEHGDGRGRHRPELQHVHAHGGEAGDQRRLDHVAGKPGVLADHDAMAVLAAAEDEAGCLPDLERQLGRDHAIGAAANAVGTEIFANHGPRLPLHRHTNPFPMASASKNI